MLSQHRIRNLEEPSLSDDHFITRRLKSSDKSTRSYSDTKNRLPSGTTTRNVSPPQCQRPSPRPQYRGRTHRGVTEPRLSLNEVRPRVTVVIYILQAVHAVLQFLYELLMVLYRKFCTVPRHPPHIPPIPTASSTSCLTTASRYSTYSTYTSSQQTTPRPTLPTNVSISAQILWNYMKLDQDLKKSDIVLIFGNFDMRTCQHACQLWVDGLAEYIMYTSVVDSRKHRLKQAQVFDALAESMNVPLECVLLETDSKNIIECITNSHKMLKRLGLKIKSIILVHLPFMERLLLLTFLQAWPVKGTNVIVTSPPITLINFPNPVVGSMEQIIQDIAEAVEFVLRYDPASRNALPDDVRAAFHTLRPQNAEEILAIRNKYISKSESRTISIDQTSIGTVELTPQTATSRSKKSGTSFVSQHTTQTRARAKMQIKTVQLSGSNNSQQTNTRSIRTQFSQHMHR